MGSSVDDGLFTLHFKEYKGILTRWKWCWLRAVKAKRWIYEIGSNNKFFQEQIFSGTCVRKWSPNKHQHYRICDTKTISYCFSKYVFLQSLLYSTKPIIKTLHPNSIHRPQLLFLHSAVTPQFFRDKAEQENFTWC